MHTEDWQRVHTINDYYDGPRLGVADLAGEPHIYESIFDYAEDEYSDRFWLMPIDAALFAAELESCGIFCRWSAAFKAGEVPLASHPALPSERQRYEELKAQIGDRRRTDQEFAEQYVGEFRSVGKRIEVRWRRVDARPNELGAP